MGTPTTGERDAAAYYTAQGTRRAVGPGGALPARPGRTKVTEEQMRALFGHGEHPDGEAIIAAHIGEHPRPGMTATH